MWSLWVILYATYVAPFRAGVVAAVARGHDSVQWPSNARGRHLQQKCGGYWNREFIDRVAAALWGRCSVC